MGDTMMGILKASSVRYPIFCGWRIFGARPDYSFIDYVAEDKKKKGLKNEEILGKELINLTIFLMSLKRKTKVIISNGCSHRKR